MYRSSFLAAIVVLFVLGVPAAAGAPDRPNPATGATIDPLLVRQLAEQGSAEAVVTTWTRTGLAAVDRLGIRGARLQLLPMVLVKRLTPAQLEQLRSSPAVRSVYANRRYRLHMEDTTWITRARYVWATDSSGGGLPGLGVTGKGVAVAVIDTGLDGGHQDAGNVVEFCETTQAVTGDHTSVTCSPFDPASGNAGPAGPTNTARGDATDDNGHGTHVSGTMAGTGDASGGISERHSTVGLSPDAKLHIYSANIGASLAAHQILASFDDLISKKLKGLNNVVAVNNSYGGGTGSSYDPENPQQIAFKRAWDAGILPVFSAGNSGPEHNTLGQQCTSPWVLCVAANTKLDSVVSFSSRGRPSEPADTNRDGVVGGTGDVAPDNHDRKLAQAFDVGLYRPGITAPGVSINAMNANAAECRAALASSHPRTPAAARARACYVQFNGTSMSAPHVTGAVPLVVEAYRKANKGRTPPPQVIVDILERSASKLPNWEAEEQGSGRLDVYAAVKLAQTYPRGPEPPALGAATVPFAEGRHPGAPATITLDKGCTGAFSWTAREFENPLLGVGQPPLSTQRYGQHLLDVAEGTERFRILVNWPRHPGANLYLRLWRPGVDPDNDDTTPPGPGRAFGDQENLNLVFTGNSRTLDVRAPEAGTWTLRVYHRANGVADTCDANSSERPKQVEGIDYNLKIERIVAAASPTVTIGSVARVSDRWFETTGTASYPAQWDGVTNYEVAGSGNPAVVADEDNRLVLHLHGNPGAAHPEELACTGDGATDVVACGGPFLLPSGTLSPGTAASWKVATPLTVLTSTERSLTDPNWVWPLGGTATTVAGPMTVEWWGSCAGCDADLGLSADWRIRLWADGVLVTEQRVTATPSAPSTAERLEATINVPETTASNRFVVHVDPVYIDTQNGSVIYYDSAAPCPTAVGTEACDSIVRMPVGAGGSGGPAIPRGVRVTDVRGGLRVAWDPASGVSEYEVHRSTRADFAPSKRTRIAKTAGTACDSPSVPTWPTASRPGLCYTDDRARSRVTYYYRVVSVAGKSQSAASQAAYGAATPHDRQVKVQVDRLWGPRVSEFASVSSDATQWSHLWDTLGILAGEHDVSARSFDGSGSPEDTRTVAAGG